MMPTARRAALLACLATLAVAGPSFATEQYLYVSQWGYRDVAPGAFNYAYSLDVDRNGNVFVADQLNQRIQKFTSTGTFVTLWGGSGSGPGQFNTPSGVAVDTSGSVYVADFWNYRIQKFSNAGGYLGQWGHEGDEDGEFYLPAKVAADQFGYVYVAEPEGQGPTGISLNNRIQKFTNTGAYLTQWPGITSASEVAVDRAGNVFVMDGNFVVKYASTGSYLTQWGGFGTGSGQFRYPLGLGVDKQGNVYVADSQNNRIQKFTNNGAFVTKWGSTGSGNGQFNFPCDVAVDDSGNVYVTDTNNFRIQKFRRDTPSVLLVHGICGNESIWSTFDQELTDAGYDVHTISYGNPDYSLRPAAYVAQLAAKLDQIDAPQVAVVAYSMGGLVTREYMRRQALTGKPNKVSQLVTLGTPHHGSDLLAFALQKADALDAFCSLPGFPPCHASDLIGPLLDHCLGSPYSRPALVDMKPGSWYLNRLNYNLNPALQDDSTSHGWSIHRPEMLMPGVYHASIGGTGSICDTTHRSWIWGKGATYHPSDGTVATGSAILTNSAAFRSTDIALPVGTLTHNGNPRTNCNPEYVSSHALAQKVATILASSPAGPPVAGPEALDPGTAAIEADASDSLRQIPAIVDSVPAGTIATRTVTVPATTLLSILLLSTDAHLTLQAPNGSFVTPGDANAATGVAFFDPEDGCEGFEIAHPAAGTWNIRIDASASATAQRYGCLVSYSATSETRVSTVAPVIYAGDSIRVLAQVSSGGVPRSDIGWTCRVIAPDDQVFDLPLLDDGSHGDGASGDGVYGNLRAPDAGFGSYRILATASVPGGGEFVAGTECELADVQDLVVEPADVTLSRNVVQAGDTVIARAVVHNLGGTAAIGVKVELRDRRQGVLLGSSTVDIAGPGSVTVEAPWIVAAPDSHWIEARVAPYVLDEVEYSNNSAERVVVLGTPLGVEPPGASPGLVRFDLPRPNPTTRGAVFAFALPAAGAATLELVDVLGRRIRRWSWVSLPAGAHSVVWDGRDARGSLVAPGVYLGRLEAQGRVMYRKVVLRR